MIALLSALVAPAAALDVKWWGIGPTLGTIAVPGDYPVLLPANAEDANGDPLIQKVRGDLSFGAHGVLYPTARGRLGARALMGVGFDKPWLSGQFTVEYDLAMINESGFQLMIGAGVGAGVERFSGNFEAENAYFVANYFPVRAQVTALLRDRPRAYEVDIYGAWHIIADQTYFANESSDGIRGSDLAVVPGGLYLKLGVELTVFFGDFRNEKAEGGGGKKKKDGAG